MVNDWNPVRIIFSKLFSDGITSNAWIKRIPAFKKWKILPTPGVEPGPSGWKPDILAVRPRGIMFPSGIEPETFCVLGRCDNRYTTETCYMPMEGDQSSSSTVDLQSWFDTFFLLSALVSSRDRLVVRTLRCGRSNPGSNPGHGSDFFPFHFLANFFI